MSDFYIIAPAVDTPETGNAYPAAESYDDYDFDGPRSVHKLTFREMPGFEPDIRFRLAKGANLTDVLSQAAISAHGLLVNQRAREVFEQLRLPPHKFFPATITDHRGQTHPYFWLHIHQGESESILDYNKTRFFKQKFDTDLGTLDISSDFEFWNKKNEIGSRFMIGLEHAKIINTPSYDIFCYPYGAKLVGTEASRMLAESITGLSIEYDSNLR